MLKIYSIQEIIEASNKILVEPLEVNEKHVPKEIESIILEAENSQIQNKKNDSTIRFNHVNETSFEVIKVNKNELVESMYKTFSKKIKKNTLKLILELKEEVIILTKNISLLEKQKEQEQLNQEILKKDILNLAHIENELKNNLKETQTDFNFLKAQHKNLNDEHVSLKKLYKDLDDEHISLKKLYKDLDDEHISLKKYFLNLRKILIQLQGQTISLRNNHKEINSQLNEINKYKKNEKVLREKNNILEKTIDDLKSSTNNNDHVSNISDLKNKIKHYQDENIRISSEFTESNKKFEITRQSLSELQKHKGDLIKKINSINEAIQDENIVTSVFHNDLEKDKVNVIDTNKPAKTNNNDLDEKIKNIFIQD
jgi:chromosome segregation ATPase